MGNFRVPPDQNLDPHLIVQIVCSLRYGEIGYALSDNLGEFANQPNVNICLRKKQVWPASWYMYVFKVNQYKYSSRFRNHIEVLKLEDVEPGLEEIFTGWRWHFNLFC